MAIKFQDREDPKMPPKKDVGGKTDAAEQPGPKPASAQDTLPFAKPVRPEKKGRKVRGGGQKS